MRERSGPGEVLAGPGVDPDALARVHEEGNLQHQPGLKVAGLRAPETRSPWTPGSVSATVSSTAAGRSTPTISAP